jgi:signal transduction histidine kinase
MTAAGMDAAPPDRPGPDIRRSLLIWWPWGMLVLSLAYIALGGGGGASSGGLPVAGIVLAVVTGSLATTTVLLTVDVEPRPAQQRARRLLGAALFLWTLAEGYRAIAWALSGAAPGIPSLADLLRLAGYMSTLAAAVSYSSSAGGSYGRLRELLDTAILVIAGAALSWLVIIRPVSMALPSNTVLLGWASVAPVFDLVLVLLALRLLAGAGSSGEARGFLGISLAFLALLSGDLVRGYLSLGGEIGLQTLPEGGWGIAACVIGLIVPRALPEEPAEYPEVPVARPLRQRMESLLPIAVTYAVVGFTILNWWLVREVDWVGVGAAAVLSLLLVARQGVIGGQSEMRQFAALVNASADLAFVCQEDGLMLLTNPAVQASLRVDTAPATAGDFLVAPTPSQAFLHQALHGGWSGEVELRRGDGSLFPASLNLRPVWDERLGRALLVGTAHDLTHIRERENDLRAALSEVAVARSDLEALNAVLERRVSERTQELAETVERLHQMNLELQELGRLKSEFVTLVSHELRAPLTNIRAGVELTLATNPEVDPAAQERLTLVAAETERLARFVEAILDLSALEAGRFPLRPGPADLGQAAGRVADRLRAQHGEDRIVLDLPETIPAVLADERALESTFFHLLDNALKYAPTGEVRVKARTESAGVEVTVTDRGPGIPTEERERVFERFHRLDSRDSREVYGHGLGLHLTRRLLEAMGGWIRAESADGGGTRMVFWLPQAASMV